MTPPTEEHESGGLRKAFAERRISLRTMDAPLRLATAGAAASLLGAALLITLRDVAGGAVVLPPTGGVLTMLPGPLFTATLVLLALGFGYVMTGAVLADRAVAVVGVLAMTGVIGFETGVLGLGGFSAVLPAWARLATRLLLTAIWCLAIATTWWRRGRHGDAAQDRAARVILLLANCGLFGGYLLVLRIASPDLNGLTLFPAAVNVVMVGVSLLCVPILQIAATDFGEWGQLTGERLLAAAGSHRRLARAAVPAAGCVALLVTAYLTQRGAPARRVGGLGVGAAVFAVAVAVLVLVGRTLRLGRQTWPRTQSFAQIFVVVAAGTWLIAPAVSALHGGFRVAPTPEVSAAGEYTAAANVRSVALPGGATLLVPVGWLSQTGHGAIAFYDTSPVLGTIAMEIATGKLSKADTLISLARSQRVGVPDGPVRRDGQALRLRLTPEPPRTVAVAWLARARGDIGYLFVGTARSKAPGAAARQLEAMVRSFRPAGVAAARIPARSAVDTPAAAALAGSDRQQAWDDAALAALSVVGLGLVAGRGRRWPGSVRAAIALFVTCSIMTVVYFADSLGRVLMGASAHWPFLSETGLLAGVGALGLASLALARGRTEAWAKRLPEALTGLAGGVLALRLLDTLYSHALAASRIAVWAAVIVLVAIGWDITMSGESLTNHASRRLPRASRVLVFLGYAIMLSATVVFFSGQRVVGSGQAVGEVYFEPEAITQSALFRLAAPLLILMFLLRVFGAEEAKATGGGHAPQAGGGETVAGRAPVVG